MAATFGGVFLLSLCIRFNIGQISMKSISKRRLIHPVDWIPRKRIGWRAHLHEMLQKADFGRSANCVLRNMSLSLQPKKKRTFSSNYVKSFSSKERVPWNECNLCKLATSHCHFQHTTPVKTFDLEFYIPNFSFSFRKINLICENFMKRVKIYANRQHRKTKTLKRSTWNFSVKIVSVSISQYFFYDNRKKKHVDSFSFFNVFRPFILLLFSAKTGSNKTHTLTSAANQQINCGSDNHLPL